MSGTSRRTRLDTELVRRGLVPSRHVAREVIAAGRVTVDGAPGRKPATQVARTQQLAVDGPPRRWVSRGGDKLDGALSALDVPVAGRVALDAGASTGGFTDVLLAYGARTVVAVDVGYGQLAWRLRTDPRVLVRERTHVRDLTAAHLDGLVPQVVVADLSFIGLAVLLAPLASVAAGDADWCCLVKPQFEAGRRWVAAGGVVTDPQGWRAAVTRVVDRAAQLGLTVVAGVVSPVPGPAGNIEFFLHLRGGAGGPAGPPAQTDGLDHAGEAEGLVDRLVRDGLALRKAVAG